MQSVCFPLPNWKKLPIIGTNQYSENLTFTGFVLLWLMSKEDNLVTAPFWAWKELLALSGLPSTMPFEEAESVASDWAEELLGDQYRRLSTSALTTKLATFRATELACQETFNHGIDPDPSETRVGMLVAGAKVSLVCAILRERGLNPEAVWTALQKHPVSKS